MNKIYQKEYETYMKEVTDNFIKMQSDNIAHSYTVDWEKGLSWQLMRDWEQVRDGNIIEENRTYNASIAKKYLESNSLTYDEYVLKYMTK